MTQANAPSMTRDGAEIRLVWPDLVVIAFDRAGEIEVGQFASEAALTQAEVEARARAFFS